MRGIYGFLRLAWTSEPTWELSDPFDHPSEARTQVVVMQNLRIVLRQLATVRLCKTLHLWILCHPFVARGKLHVIMPKFRCPSRLCVKATFILCSSTNQALYTECDSTRARHVGKHVRQTFANAVKCKFGRHMARSRFYSFLVLIMRAWSRNKT